MIDILCRIITITFFGLLFIYSWKKLRKWLKCKADNSKHALWRKEQLLELVTWRATRTWQGPIELGAYVTYIGELASGQRVIIMTDDKYLLQDSAIKIRSLSLELTNCQSVVVAVYPNLQGSEDAHQASLLGSLSSKNAKEQSINELEAIREELVSILTQYLTQHNVVVTR